MTENTKNLFQEYELDAYLGTPGDFDVQGIIDEATEVDYSDGNRYWVDGIDLDEIAERHHRKVRDEKGRLVDLDAATQLMDRDISEQMVAEGEWETNQEWFEEYARRHREKHGEDFVPWAGGDW